MALRTLLAFFLAGISTLVSQMLILRELMIIYTGNELSIALVLSNWLILSGIGSLFVSKFLERIKFVSKAYSFFVLILSLSMLMAIFFARNLKNVLGVPIGLEIGFFDMFYTSFIILFPIAFSNGALFTLSCRILANFQKKDANTITKAYVYGTLGTILGGIAWTFILIPLLTSIHIALVLAICNSVASLAVLKCDKNAFKTINLYLIKNVVLIALCLITIFSGYSSKLHQVSIEMQWHPLTVVHYQNSIHGNITVTKTESHYTFFHNGVEQITLPIPDLVSIEEFTHIPMLTHASPKSILVLGSGAGGVIYEILRHPTVNLLHYAEIDPTFISLMQKFPSDLTDRELGDPRVKVKTIDGRQFLDITDINYDIIFVVPSNPSNMRTNRYFTHEFFTQAKLRLNYGGMLVLRTPGGQTFVTQELKDLNSSIYHTVKSTFEFVRSLPGASTNLILASEHSDVVEINPQILSDRMLSRNILYSEVVPWHIERMLHPGWSQWFDSLIAGSTTEINRDFLPRSVFYSIAHWNTFYAPYLQAVFSFLKEIDLLMLFASIFVFTLMFAVLNYKKQNKISLGIPLCIATTGFAGMIFDLSLIFAFQAFYGYVFAWIGILVAAFMAGISVGALFILRLARNSSDNLRMFILLDFIIITFSIIMPIALIYLGQYLIAPQFSIFAKALFISLAVFSGGLIGSQFPIANKLYLDSKGEKSFNETAGLIYGADLLGGGLGGILGGVILFPIIGLLGMFIVIVLLKSASLFIILSK